MATKRKTQQSKTTRKKASKSAAGKTTAANGKSKVAANGNSKIEAKPRKAKPVSQEQRHRMIAEAAYQRAEARGFREMDQVGDWLAAEREVDKRLAHGASV